MKLNKKIREISKKMHNLKIPRKERRKYLERAFTCSFRHKSWLEYQTLNDELDELKGHVCPEEVVRRIDLSFSNLYDRYSEENYQSHWVTSLGRKLP